MNVLARERLQDFTKNGPKVTPTFSAAEMQRRLDAIRGTMAKAGIDAALFTSYHNINYYSDFLYCYFGRRYGLVVTHDASTSISAVSTLSVFTETPGITAPMHANILPPTFQASWPPPHGSDTSAPG